MGAGVASYMAEVLIPLPHLTLWRLARQNVDSLTATRAVLVNWLHVALLIIVVVWVTLSDADKSGSVEPGLFTAGVCAFGLVALGLVRYMGSRPLNVSSAQDLATSYRASFFVGMALSQSVFLMSFVGAFVTGEWRVIFVGLPFMLVGFWMTAATDASLTRKQRQIYSEGSSLDLIDVLVSTPFKMSPRTAESGASKD